MNSLKNLLGKKKPKIQTDLQDDSSSETEPGSPQG